jgi:hypothetical protein
MIECIESVSNILVPNINKAFCCETADETEVSAGNENIETQDNTTENIKFSRDVCLMELRKIKPIPNEAERVLQAKDFILESVLSKEGEPDVMEIFIISDVYNYFGAPAKQFWNPIMKSYTAILKDMRKKQKNDNNKTTALNHARVDTYNISSEFKHLYVIKEDSYGSQTITAYPDRIADHICSKYNVINFNDNMYIYMDGYYQNLPQIVNAEAMRILTGIYKNENSNGIAGHLRDVMSVINNRNRISEYPFNTVYKAIPCKNGVIVLDENSNKPIKLIEKPDPREWVFDYIFPIKYDPKAPTEQVMKELSKYVDDPRVLLQPLAQAIIQKITSTPCKKAYLFYGEPNFGKSFIVIDLYGERFISNKFRSDVSLNRLADGSDNKFCVASLEGKIMNICDETPYFNMADTATFKRGSCP